MLSRPVKVLISGGLASGGVQTHVTALCENLDSREFQFTLFGARTGWSRGALQAAGDRGARVLAPGWRNPLLQKLEAGYRAWQLSRRRFDVLLLLGSSRLHERLLSCVKPGGFAIYNEINQFPNAAMEPLVRQMDGLIAISRFTERQLQRRFPGIPVRPLCHFPNYSARQAAETVVDLGDRQLRLVFIGRVDSQKRPDLLVERWKDFAATAPVAPARLDIYGSGDEALTERMRASIRGQGLADVIHIHGAYERAALDDILERADLVLNPSSYEGIGLVLLEAMQRGVPVVATEAGGSADLGEGNLDSLITTGNEWPAFCAGVREMAVRSRAGQVDRARLRQWVDHRYGKQSLLRQWREALADPRGFFAEGTGAARR